MRLARSRWRFAASVTTRWVAVVEIVSPGNKNNQNGLSAFVWKVREALAAGIPPVNRRLVFRRVRAIRKQFTAPVWGEDCDADYALPPGQSLDVALPTLAVRALRLSSNWSALGTRCPPCRCS